MRSASSGAYISLIAIPVIAYGEMQDVGRRVGMCMTFLAFGALFGPPISAAINQSTGNFNAVGLYAGENDQQKRHNHETNICYR